MSLGRKAVIKMVARNLIPVWSKFKCINQLLFHLKSSKSHKFSDDFRVNRNSLILLNLLNIKNEIWRRKLLVRVE